VEKNGKKKENSEGNKKANTNNLPINHQRMKPQSAGEKKKKKTQ